jgi:hypothetical protein
MEDVQFLADGLGDYPATMNHADWFNNGGFAKVQPYYTRNCEVYAMRDEVKPFIRSYFNSFASLLNPEVLTLWEHFHHRNPKGHRSLETKPEMRARRGLALDHKQLAMGKRLHTLE